MVFQVLREPQTVLLLVTTMAHMNRCPLSITVNSQNSSYSLRPPVGSEVKANIQPASLIGTDVKIILADVLHTCCKLSVLVIQSRAVNAAKVESDVLYCASLADPCEMESLAVRAHIGHCCVSVGLVAVLHLRCTRDELDLAFSMLPWHSMGAVRCQVLPGPRTALSASVPPIPPLRRICLCRAKNLTKHMLSRST